MHEHTMQELTIIIVYNLLVFLMGRVMMKYNDSNGDDELTTFLYRLLFWMTTLGICRLKDDHNLSQIIYIL